MDLVGLDLVQRIQTYLLPDLDRSREPPAMLTALVAGGRLGVKARHGFYDWDEQSAAALTSRRDRAILANLDRLA
jgi:3-hydroxybutyryl-CoA dehydrogenase